MVDFEKETIKGYISDCLEEAKYKGMRRNEIVRCVGEKIYGRKILNTTEKEFKKVGKKVDRILSQMDKEVKNRKEKKGGITKESTYWLSKYFPSVDKEIEEKILDYTKEISENVKKNGEGWLPAIINDKIRHVTSEGIPLEIIKNLAQLYQKNALEKKEIDETAPLSVSSKLGLGYDSVIKDILFIIAALSYPIDDIRKRAWSIIANFNPHINPSPLHLY